MARNGKQGRGGRGGAGRGNGNGKKNNQKKATAKGACADLGEHVFVIGEARQAEKAIKTFERICYHIPKWDYGQDIANALESGEHLDFDAIMPRITDPMYWQDAYYKVEEGEETITQASRGGDTAQMLKQLLLQKQVHLLVLLKEQIVKHLLFMLLG